MTAQSYIISALRKCGQMRPGYIPQPELLAEGLQEWTMMVDGFNARRTMNYTIPDYIYPITGAGTAALASGQVLGMGYSIGPSGADFIGPRPEEIVKANLWTSTISPTQPVRIPLTRLSAEEWATIPLLQLTPITITTSYYYEPRYPNGVIWLWPPINANSLEIFTWGVLTPPATLATVFAAPPGYAEVVMWELAKRLWSMCTKDMMPHRASLQWICGQAEIAKNAVRSVNAPHPRIVNDFDGGQHDSRGACDWSLLLTGVS
jgi:hypothetical protein